MELDSEINKIDTLDYAQLETYLSSDPKSLLDHIADLESLDSSQVPAPESEPASTVSTRTSNVVTRRSLPSINKKIALFTRANTRLKVLNSTSSNKLDQEPQTSSTIESGREEKTERVERPKLANTSPTVTHLAPNEYIIQGKKIKMTPSECQRFTRNGKWRCNEFFRFKTVEAQHECEFCTTKCKTVIEGVYVCAACRHFGYKALVKHHMFVCKNQSLSVSNPGDHENAVLCEFRQLANTAESSSHHSNASTYCRYCHFYSIVNRLPSLRRLQKYLVLFVKNRVLFVNSVSKKTMMWKSRLQLGSLEASGDAKLAKKSCVGSPVKVARPNGSNLAKISSESVPANKKMTTRESKATADSQYYYNFKSGGSELKREHPSLLSSNKENDFLVNENSNEDMVWASSGAENQRTGPRVKHVSRYHPTHLSLISNLFTPGQPSLDKDHPFKCTFYTNLKRINQDLGPMCISWQTFLADVKSDFSLSAMPQTFKDKIFYKYEQTRLSLMDQAASASATSGLAEDNSASVYDFNESSDLNRSIKKSFATSNNLNSNKKKSAGSNKNARKHTMSEMIDEEEFDWDEYFDVNHRISTSQNTRYLQSLSSAATQLLGSAGNISRNITNVNSNTNLPESNSLANTNSESPSSFLASNKKKRFDDRLNSYKDAASIAASTVITASASGTNLLVDDTNIAAAAAVVAYNMITASNSKKTSQNQPNTIIWDNNIVNNFNDLNKSGFAVVSYRPICLKSICFLCGSNSELDSNQLIYCNICCEPYHQFCLEEHERPKATSCSSPSSLLNWTCPTCKFCEICGHADTGSGEIGSEPQLQSCAKCNDAYHVECLKRAQYPKRACKKKKVWICAKCFECNVCGSRSIQFDKKFYNKLVNYDFGSCLRCYEKYQLEKPLRCCFLFATHNLGNSKLDDRIVQCDTCLSWTHYACNDLTDEEIEFVKGAKLHYGPLFKFECKSCDNQSQPGGIRQKLNEFKMKCIGDLFTEVNSLYNLGIESKLVDFLNEKRAQTDSIDLLRVYTELLDSITTEIEAQVDPVDPEKASKIRESMKQLIDTKYQYLKQYVNPSVPIVEPVEDIKPESTDKTETQVEPMDTTSNQMSSEPGTSVEASATLATEASASTTASVDPTNQSNQISQQTAPSQASDSKVLAEKKKQFFMNELVKCPYDDHTYAISSSSIAVALQSSNIFNQNNTSENLNTFLNQIKDMQVNPKLQTILSKMIDENKTTYTNNTASDQAVPGEASMKQFDNLISEENESSDSRDCFTCRLLGDDPICGRLLPFDSYWIHTNCLLWTDEVCVTQGTMIDPIEAVLNRTKTKCSVCEKERATIRCTFDKSCNKFYHFKCAYQTKCAINHKLQSSDSTGYLSSSSNHKKMFTLHCASHAIVQHEPAAETKEPMEVGNVDMKEQTPETVSTEGVVAKEETSPTEPVEPQVLPSQSETTIVQPDPVTSQTLNINRRLIIDVPDELYSKKKYARLRFNMEENKENEEEIAPYILVGSVQVKNLGDLETISDYRNHLCPINFKSSRLYWSTKEVGKKCLYTCRIRHIEAYKRDFKNRSNLITSLIDKMISKSDDTVSDDMAVDEFRSMEIQESRPVELDPLSQLDGQDDTSGNPSTNMQFQSKTILKFPTASTTTTTFVQRPTMASTTINRPIVNTNMDASGKPKVVKLDSLKCFSNIKTPGLNLPGVSATASSMNNMNSNRFMILNQNVKQPPAPAAQQVHFQGPSQPPGTVFYAAGNKLSISTQSKNTVLSNLMSLQSSTSSSFTSAMSASSSNENLISPKSDKSDSSLNLNHSASIQNPLKASFEDISSLGLLTAVSGSSVTYDPNSIKTVPHEFYFQPPNPVPMLHVTTYNHQGAQSSSNGVKKKNSMPKQSKKRMRSEESPVVSSNSSFNTSNNDSLSQPPANNSSSSGRSSNKCTVAALLSACSTGQVPSNLTLKRGDKIAQKLMQITGNSSQPSPDLNSTFSPLPSVSLPSVTPSPATMIPITLNQSQDSATLLMSMSQGLNSSQMSTSLLDNSMSASPLSASCPPPAKSSKSKSSTKTSPNKAPKPPAAKKPPQAKLRDYFSEKDQNTTVTNTTSTNNNLSDEQTKQIKRELREMMAAARNTNGEEPMLPFRKSLAGRKKKNLELDAITDTENTKKTKKLKKLEDKLESKKKLKENKLGQMAKKNLYKDSMNMATSPTCNFSSNGFLFENEYNDLDLDQFGSETSSSSSNNNQHGSQLVFEIVAEDGFRVVSYDINKAWRVITDKVNRLRQEHKLKSLSFRSLSGVRMYGLCAKATVFMLEQMDSIEFCPLYTSKYINRDSANDKWIINLNNCARTTSNSAPGRKCFDQFYWLASEHRSLSFLNNIGQRFNQQFLQANKALTSVDICNSLKFRHLKEFSKSALLVKKSTIHGRGLFTLVDLAQGQMIIEYAGEIIRNELCNRREKYYESKGIGCYMFRIDEYEVIDATTKGNQARFINHSCEPSCHSRVLLVQGVKHIVIFAQRNIARGEELTYDYKFPKEDDKIKCLCKSAKCRKYLN